MKTTAVRQRWAEAPQRQARIAGVFYLLNILTILLAVFFFRGLVVPRDPAATAANIQRHESLFRLAFALELISTTCSIVVAALFYELLRPVNRSLSLVAAFFRLVACAVAIVGYLLQLAPLVIFGGTQPLDGFKPEELQTLGLVLMRLRGSASDVVIVFFGFHFVAIGYLIFQSTFLPRGLGVLAGLGGLGGLIFLAPPLARILFPFFLAVGLVVEVSLTTWLLAKGVNNQRWREKASAAECG